MSFKKLKLATLTKVVASAGTAVALHATANTLAFSLIITAQEDNTGFIYIGDSAIDSTSDPLAPGESISITPSNHDDSLEYGYDLNQIYIDSSVSTDGVWVKYEVIDSRIA
jgi:hypothetical protein